MKLLSIQPRVVWDQLAKTHHYQPPTNLFELDPVLREESQQSWGMTHAYTWLKDQMIASSVQTLKSPTHLIWAWRHEAAHEQLDLRSTWLQDQLDQDGVLLELDIPSSRLCLTDYELWHWVLNYWYAGTQHDSLLFEKSNNYWDHKPLPDATADVQLRRTWLRVFDLAGSRDLLEQPVEKQKVQASFFDLLYTDVTKVHFFRGDKKTGSRVLRPSP